MTITKADLIEILKSFIYGSQGAQLQQKAGTHELLVEDTGLNIRKALREELTRDTLNACTALYSPVKTSLFDFITSPYWAPAASTYRSIEEALVLYPALDNSCKLVYVDYMNQSYSRKHFRYGQYGLWVKFPAGTASTLNVLYFGAEVTGRAVGGAAMFTWYGSQLAANKGYLCAISIGRVGERVPNVTLPYAVDGNVMYTVKVNRASVEFYQTQYKPILESRLLGITQFSEGSDTYDVASSPYYLGQARGCLPSSSPLVLEWIANQGVALGESPIQVNNIWASDGDPAPPRSLEPYTGGVAWEGTAVNPDITSDGIPIAGYDMKTIHFLATGAGTLEISVDYGDNAYDVYDSVPIAANTLEVYPFIADALWLKLKFTPTAAPKTITRARVLMR